MNFWVGASLITGIVSALITIYLFIEIFTKGKHIQRVVVFSLVTAIIFLASWRLTYLPPAPGNGDVQQGTPIASPSQNGTTPATSPTETTPLTTPSPPLSKPAPGTMLYQSDANWTGWSANQWGILNGQLETNGRGDTWIRAPYNPGQHNISDYSVEATINLNAYNGCYYCGFGIAARADNNNNGYLLAVCAVAGLQVCGGNNNLNYQAQLVIGQDFVNGAVPYLTQYQTPEKQSITYRLECKGDTITGYISFNNIVLGPITDLTTTAGGEVRLFTDNAQLLISSVVIKAL